MNFEQKLVVYEGGFERWDSRWSFIKWFGFRREVKRLRELKLVYWGCVYYKEVFC